MRSGQSPLPLHRGHRREAASPCWLDKRKLSPTLQSWVRSASSLRGSNLMPSTASRMDGAFWSCLAIKTLNLFVPSTEHGPPLRHCDPIQRKRKPQRRDYAPGGAYRAFGRRPRVTIRVVKSRRNAKRLSEAKRHYDLECFLLGHSAATRQGNGRGRLMSALPPKA